MNTTTKARVKSPAPSEAALAKGRVLVVEDEKDLRDLLQYNLSREGFAVDATERGEEAIRMVQKNRPDLVLLDLMLPGIDGLEVCRNLKSDKQTSSIPIVMLTAKGEESDIVVGLEMGADDYITKPFSPRILLARLKAVMRRPVTEDEAPDKVLRLGRVEIHPDRHEILVDGKAVGLTATEFKLLHLLARRPGRVFTRQQIIDMLHEGFAAVTDRSVDVQVVSLRRKLGDAADMVRTVRGVGYRFIEESLDE